MKAKVNSPHREPIWMNLPKPLWEGKERITTGICLTGLYKGAKTGRTVARFDSQWVDGQGRMEGESFAQIEPSTWLEYCEIAGIDPQVEAEEL